MGKWRVWCFSACLIALLTVGNVLSPAWARGGAPKIMVSIKPIHSLVAGVMRGVADPKLLVATGSPHLFSLRPSNAGALARADAVVWVGAGLFPVLEKFLATLGPGAVNIELSKAPGQAVLGLSGATGGQAIDPHLWLNPKNAMAMVRAIVARLSAVDPGHAPAYAANGKALEQRLARLDHQIEATLAPVRDRPFVVYHDAYQYFVARYGLANLGAVTVDPGRAPSVARITQIRAQVRARQARCIFTEPVFAAKIAQVIANDADMTLATLDPLGADLDPGPELYFTMMRGLASALKKCLAPKN